MPDGLGLIDAHCHLGDPAYPDPVAVVERAREQGVMGVAAAGTGPASNAAVLAIARRLPHAIWPCIGLHPEAVSVAEETVEEVLEEIRRLRPVVVGVGEVGLPYYAVRDGRAPAEAMAVGRRRLERFIGLARELGLAVALHAPHEAAATALDCLRKAGVRRAMFHWHKAPDDVTDAIVTAGYCVSVTPEVCYRERDRRLVAHVPLGSLILESDGPWPYRGEFEGRPTEPWMIRRVAEEVASIKSLTIEEVTAQTLLNTFRLFRGIAW
jgi:TatD DNase family protein